MSADAPSTSDVQLGAYQYGFHDSTDFYSFKSRKGLDQEIVCQISGMKQEPEWMRDFRLRSL
ncbi:MAG: Fe-S cluster assembly protein SufB, partial [Planctomycetaceae bacterium]